MAKSTQLKMDVQGIEITVVSVGDEDYISLTDMTRKFGDENLIYNWMRNRNTVEFLGIWEQMHNPNFKGIEFDTFKNEAGSNAFTLTPKKWIEATNAIGIRSQSGRYNGGTYAHKDLAFEFGTWLDPAFKLFLIQEFQRLKEHENRREKLDWNLHRTLSKINYQVHTDAVKTHIVPLMLTPAQISHAYANEADLLNMALFGRTAKQWREENPTAPKSANIREDATIEQLLVLSNLESMNAQMLEMQWQPVERLKRLNEVAIDLLEKITKRNSAEKLKQATDPKKLK